MEAKELRIGNHLLDTDGNVIVFDLGFFGRLSITGGECIDEFKPIPLTEEWLEKFGFEKIGSRFEIDDWFTAECEDNDF